MALRVAFIGAGKVGCSLARYLGEAGSAEIVGFFSRSADSAREAATFAGGRAFSSPAEAAGAADVIFLTTPDAAIAAVAESLAAKAGEAGLAGKVVAHCSGATPSEVLAPCRASGAKIASMHPLYAVSSRFDCYQELAQAFFTLEGADVALDALESLIAPCKNRFVRIPAEQKTRYHAAAVMASNLVVGLFEIATEELVTCGFSPDEAKVALAPLFLGNAEHIAAAGPAASLTGPAARGDLSTIEAHLSCLCGENREVYRLLTEVLYRMASQD